MLALLLSMEAGKTVGLCGGIGVGKSTLGRKLVEACRELVAAFEEERVDQALLEAYIKDSTEYAAHFQTIMAMHAVQREQRATELAQRDRLVFVERPLVENRVFAKANLRSGQMTQAYYKDWYSELFKAYNSRSVDLLLFLYAPYETRLERKLLRARSSEELYKDQYMRTLDECYFDFVIEMAGAKKLLLVDWSSYGSTDAVLELVLRVLRGERSLPNVVRFKNTGQTQAQLVVHIGNEVHHFYTKDPQQQRYARELIMKGLARLEDIVMID
jgi:deoxyadenosine/deoxycytidine kinase